MKATVHLHVGLHKTGTTSIQATMFHNRARLRALGINYLAIGQNHSETLFPLFCDHPHLYHVNIAMGVNTEAKAARRNAATDRSLEQELEANTCPHLVISGEDLIRLTRRGIERLKQRLASYTAEFCVVVYVRDPYAFINSAFQQRLRGGATYDELIANPPKPGYRRIRKYIAAFGRENVDIRVFEPGRFIHGNLIADFLAAIGAEPRIAKELEVIRANEALSLEAALILNEINKRYPKAADGVPNPGRAPDLMQRLAGMTGQRFRCPTAAIAAVEPLLAEDLAWLHDVLGEIVFATKLQWEEPLPLWSGETLASLAVLLNDMARELGGERKTGIPSVHAVEQGLPGIAAMLRRWSRVAG